MASLSDITRFHVEDGYLNVIDPDTGYITRFPVIGFDVSFAMDQIPSATVIPAIGMELGAEAPYKNISTLEDIKPRSAAVLYMKVNGTVHKFIDGYISDVSTDDHSTFMSRRIYSTITVKHRAVKLAVAPPTSFVYSGKVTQTLPVLSQRLAKMNVFDPKGSADGTGSINPIETYVAKALRANPKVAYYPGSTLKDIVKGLYGQMNDEQLSQEDIEGMIKTYDQANLTSLAVHPVTFLKDLSHRYKSNWMNGNAWQALVNTSKYLLMHVIPFSDGFYIANPYSLDRTPTLKIGASEYIRLSKHITDTLAEPINGVVMYPPSGVPYAGGDLDRNNVYREMFTFPHIQDGKGTVRPRSYYHYRQFPSWMLSYAQLQKGTPQKGKAHQKVPDVKPGQGKDASWKAYFKRLGALYVQALYGQLMTTQAAITITFPFRTDIMPGTVIQLENSETSVLSFVGDSLYGMVTAVKFSVNAMAEEPTLVLTAQVSSIRNTEQNKDDNYTFDGSPIFDKRWTGIDLSGAFVVEPETPTNKLPSTTGRAYNATSAKVETK